jgi:hypothetical protein
MEILAFVSPVIDASLFMLALLVQRIIYPTFDKVHLPSFGNWHQRYTKEIGRIVAPLMLLQLVISALFWWNNTTDLVAIFTLMLVVFTWIDTFARAIVIHNNLQQQIDLAELRVLTKALVRVNLPRTIAWLLVLLLNFADVAEKMLTN